ncbi:hypothetical protein [Neptunomonas phycophila]|uniref:hypothetical protein n=1 Tax=Neptunomonas phycophila TaxID=1572645 RepID=UPI0009488B8C|nr:hypothetical protein [Neptunomonas phycophila]
MSKMSGVNRLEVEKYSCPDCEVDLNDEDVRNSWRCPKCNDFVHIWAHDPGTNTKITLVRKRADEVEEGDMVHLPGQLTKDCYWVLGISKVKSQIGIGLKGYGQYKLAADEPVNCRIGGG